MTTTPVGCYWRSMGCVYRCEAQSATGLTMRVVYALEGNLMRRGIGVVVEVSERVIGGSYREVPPDELESLYGIGATEAAEDAHAEYMAQLVAEDDARLGPPDEGPFYCAAGCGHDVAYPNWLCEACADADDGDDLY